MFFDRLPNAGYVCAHRGARSLAPENTLLAAQRCVELGADYWEFDVQKSADGSLVIFHDNVLDRTTNIANLPHFKDHAPWATHAFTLKELRSLDAGSWFIADDPFGTIARGKVPPANFENILAQRIPTLLEALEFSCRHSLPMNLEIKDQLHAPEDVSIVQDVLQLIHQTQAEDLILISSFNHDYLREVRRRAPNMPLAALVEDAHPKNLVEYLKTLDAAAYHPDKDITDPDLIRSLAAHGIRVAPYTVNDMSQALSLMDAGCFGIITDFPDSLRCQLANRAR